MTIVLKCMLKCWSMHLRVGDFNKIVITLTWYYTFEKCATLIELGKSFQHLVQITLTTDYAWLESTWEIYKKNNVTSKLHFFAKKKKDCQFKELHVDFREPWNGGQAKKNRPFQSDYK